MEAAPLLGEFTPQTAVQLPATLPVLRWIDLHGLLLATSVFDDTWIVLVCAPLLQKGRGFDTMTLRNRIPHPLWISRTNEV